MGLRRSRWNSTLNSQSVFENPILVIYQKDLSTRRSCSDFLASVNWYASTARDDGVRVESDVYVLVSAAG